MPDYKTNTRIVLTDPDLPEPGEVREHHIGPYTILIDYPDSGAGRLVVTEPPVMPPDPLFLAEVDAALQGKPPEDKPDAPTDRFVVALMDLKKTIYTHAVEMRRHGGSRRARVSDFALCNGRNNGRPVRGRDTTRTLADVDCPRCLRRIEKATAEETT